jgi:hypothetical protein
VFPKDEDHDIELENSDHEAEIREPTEIFAAYNSDQTGNYEY